MSKLPKNDNEITMDESLSDIDKKVMETLLKSRATVMEYGG